jgi:thymidine kinase
MTHADIGKIKLIIGPMFSGKTSCLCEEIRIYQAIDKTTFCINHQHDTRYGDNAIFTHYGEKIPAVMTDSLLHLIDNPDYLNADLVAINEGQFFPDLVDFCVYTKHLGKDVVVSALDGDYKQEMFPQIASLLPKADKKIFKTAKCKICKDHTDAPFTKRIVSNTSQVLIGGKSEYIPVCGKCFRSK